MTPAQRAQLAKDAIRETELRDRRIAAIKDVALAHMRNGMEDIGIYNLPSLKGKKREDIEAAIRLAGIALKEERYK